MAEAIAQDHAATVVRLVHDVEKRTSLVVLVWKSGEHRLNLAVPYGTRLENVREAAEDALRQHSENMARTSVGPVSL